MPRSPRQVSTVRQRRLNTQQIPLSNPHATTANPTSSNGDINLDNDVFLSELANEQSWRFRPRAQMTDEQHAAFLERAKNAPSIARSWARGTMQNVFIMDRKWEAYCVKNALGDPELALAKTDRATAMSFLIFMCANCNINTTDTLWQYFRTWKQLYHHIVGKEFDQVDSGDVYHFFKAEVIKAYRLKNSQARKKNVVDASDLLAMLTYAIAFDKRTLPNERVRLSILACYLILGYTGCQPAEIVDGEKKVPTDPRWKDLFDSRKLLQTETASDSEFEDDFVRQSPHRPNALCYEDVTLFVCIHPDAREHCLGAAIKFTHHKGHDNKLKPTTFFFYETDRVMFDLVLLLFILALRDGAFASEHITTVESVFNIRVPDGLEYLPLQWKKEWLTRPVFRSSDDDLSKPMSYRALHEYMRDHSLEMGYADAIGPKDFRRHAANTANRTATGPERDQIMRHNEGSGTFRHSYLNQTVEHDMIAAVLNAVSQENLLQKLAHAGHARDRRAKRDMVPPEIWATLRQKGEAPDIVEMVQKRAELRTEAKALPSTLVDLKEELGQEADRLTRRINSRRATEKRHVIVRYHDFYFKTVPTCDVNRQINGNAPLEYTPPVIDCQLAERNELALLLTEEHPGKLNSEQLRALRIRIGCLYLRLGHLREPAHPRVKQFIANLDATPAPKSSPSPVPDHVSYEALSPEHYSPSPSPVPLSSSPSPSLSPPPSSSPSPSPSSVTPTSPWTSYPVVSENYSPIEDSNSYQYQAPSPVYAAPATTPPPQETWTSTLQYALGYSAPAESQISSYSSTQLAVGNPTPAPAPSQSHSSSYSTLEGALGPQVQLLQAAQHYHQAPAPQQETPVQPPTCHYQHPNGYVVDAPPTGGWWYSSQPFHNASYSVSGYPGIYPPFNPAGQMMLSQALPSLTVF